MCAVVQGPSERGKGRAGGAFQPDSIATEDSDPAAVGSFRGGELLPPLLRLPGRLSRPEHKLKDYK